MDIVDAIKRSEMMAGIRSKNTRPELKVRKFLHARGFRYRLHTRELPGSPDLTLPKHQTVIFVHGCFWHRHAGCRYATEPSSNTQRWETKFKANLARDQRNVSALRELGWRVIIVWECEIRGNRPERLDLLVSEIDQPPEQE